MQRNADAFVICVWATNLFQKESGIGNQKSNHQIAFLATQNVYWNIWDT